MFDFIEDEDLRSKVEEEHNNTVTTLNEGFTTKLAEETDGLKRSRDTILDEKKKIEKKFKGIDVEEIAPAMEFYSKNKDAEFLKTGKLEELVEQKTSQLKADHEAAFGEVNTALEEAQSVGTKFQGLYETKILEDEIRANALAAKVLPEALVDIVARAKSVFSLGDEFKVEARDAEGNLLKNDKDLIVTPKNWLETLKESAPYFWPASEGAGLGKGGSASDSTDNLEHLAKTDHAAFVEARRKQTAK